MNNNAANSEQNVNITVDEEYSTTGLSTSQISSNERHVCCPLVNFDEGCRWYGPKHKLTEHLETSCFLKHFPLNASSNLQQQQQLQSQSQSQPQQNTPMKVKDFIVKAMSVYLKKEQILDHCSQKLSVSSAVALRVWEVMEYVNPQYFHAYQLRLLVKQQMEMFNQLLEETKLLQSSPSLPQTIPPQVYNHPEYNYTHHFQINSQTNNYYVSSSDSSQSSQQLYQQGEGCQQEQYQVKQQYDNQTGLNREFEEARQSDSSSKSGPNKGGIFGSASYQQEFKFHCNQQEFNEQHKR